MRVLFVAIFLVGATAAGQAQQNIALASIGATADDNGHWNDGYDYGAFRAIDGSIVYPSYWAGLEYIVPQRMWVFFDQMYQVSEVILDERTDAYMNTGSIDLLVGGSWQPLVSISKNSADFQYAFSPICAAGIRVNVTSNTHPPGWANGVACLWTVEAIGEPCEYVRGDCNTDGNVDISDPIFNLDYLFIGGPTFCLDAQDTNDDGVVDIGDAIYGLTHLFLGGPTPPVPFPGCGGDPTPDSLGCLDYAACP